MTSTTQSAVNPLSNLGLGIPVVILVLLLMMILPLPPIVLDLLFTFNISLSLMVLLAGIYIRRPLEFSVFPTILLVATLLRLALNIASTRVVLISGHTGTQAAGQVIESFGEVVIGGNYAVGLVVFTILVIINFVVVTKGAGRISEVSARFTLDSMPGKQMAIDADLNAGIIEQKEAKQRRQEIAQEADFYGSMDGASKFVRGDAIAGILILFINILGGILIGLLQHQLGFMDAVRVYVLLTIGDGLVAQIPSLLLSTSAAIMVTRVSSSEDMGQQIKLQVFGNPKPLAICGGVLGIIGLIPGMPHLAFIFMALVIGAGAYGMHAFKQSKDKKVEKTSQSLGSVKKKEKEKQNKELSWEDVPTLDTIGLEMGYRLVPLVDSKQGGELINRIKGVRKKLSQELGFLVPSVHIRDDLNLAPNAYQISLMGVNIGGAEIHMDKDFAINPGQVFGEIEGVKTQDPAFGLEAVWINKSQREQAQTLGYTVVDPSTVIATHISQLLTKHAHELLGHEEVQKLFDILSKGAPKLVEELIPGKLPLATVVKVLQNLLEEQIPIRDMRTIAETLSELSSKSQDSDLLTEGVRTALGRLIVQQLNGTSSEIPVMVLDGQLEQILQQTSQAMGSSGVGLEPGLADKLQKALNEFVKNQEISGQAAILLVPGPLRRFLMKFAKYAVSGINVLSYNEIPNGKQIKVVSTLGQNMG